MTRCQRTLKGSASCEGIGLHSGKNVRMVLQPAPADTGIVFVRTDIGGIEIKAVASNTGGTNHATTLCRNGASVQTVEHLLAAFAGLGIDNARVELSGEEVPVLDGSAGPFVRLIADAGIVNQEKLRSMIKVIKPVIVRDGNKQLAVWPSETASISCFIDFEHPLLKKQSCTYTLSEENFIREVADARTFGFLRDVETLRANGLAKGGSLENAVILDDASVLNRDGLRYRDEFVRHKVLDLIGDLSLLGMPLIGHVVAHKSGHGLNTRLAAKILENPQNWVLIGSAEEPARHREPAYRYEMAL
jgi:UDP-3-O-[3-hydroxymyristoyl] N-acetylglucosamine deacetylase